MREEYEGAQQTFQLDHPPRKVIQLNDFHA